MQFLTVAKLLELLRVLSLLIRGCCRVCALRTRHIIPLIERGRDAATGATCAKWDMMK